MTLHSNTERNPHAKAITASAEAATGDTGMKQPGI